MELIAFGSDFKELYPVEVEIDFEVGDSGSSNDFELEDSAIEYGLYIPGTEFGGVIEYDHGYSNSNSQTRKGWTWRGLLSQWIIEPDSGNDYKIVSGEANTIIRELLSDVLGGFFVVPEVDSGLTITDYQFELHISVLKGLMDMLASYNYNLRIYAKRTASGEAISVYCEAVPRKKIEGVYDEDTGLNLAFTNNRMGINHLICWGKGELQERERIDLFMDADGNVSENQYYFGFQERQAVYENSSAESLDDLRAGGIERLKEIANSKKLEIDEVDGVDLNIGDIVVGRKNDINLIIENPIISKILRVSNGVESIEYKVKGEG